MKIDETYLLVSLEAYILRSIMGPLDCPLESWLDKL